MTPLEVMTGLLNTAEVPGPRSNPQITAMYRAVGHNEPLDDSTTAWCAACTGYALKEGGAKYLKTLTARSYCDYGNSIPVADMQVGDIFVFWRGSKSGWQGHVGLIYSITPSTITTIAGNESDRVKLTIHTRAEFLSKLLCIQRPIMLKPADPVKVAAVATPTVIAAATVTELAPHTWPYWLAGLVACGIIGYLVAKWRKWL